MQIVTLVIVFLIVAVVTWGVVEIVRIGCKYALDVEKMKNGYTLADGTRPAKLLYPKYEDEYDYAKDLSHNVN